MRVAIIVVVVVIVVLLALAAVLAANRRRRQAHLRERFGPEYDRLVADTGNRRQAEAELLDRERRRASYEIRPLPEASRRRYLTTWSSIQSSFVDAPDVAVRDADRLVAAVLAERGYPAADPDQIVGVLSVDSAALLDHYRRAHDVYQRNEQRTATTEDLRRAMQHYRALMEDLVSG